MPFKIAVLAQSCRGGGGLYQTKSLLKSIREVSREEKLLLICSAGYGLEQLELPEGSDIFVYEGKHSLIQRSVFESFVLPDIVAKYKPDVIYSPVNKGLPRPCAPQALFIRNAYYFYGRKHYPDMHIALKLRIEATRFQLKRCLPRTDLIFCQTPIVKKRFSEFYNYSENKITVLGFPPPEEIYLSINLSPPELLKEKGDNFYVLCMTCYMPHKNPGILLELCERYGSELRSKKIKFITTVQRNDHPKAGKFLDSIYKKQLEDLIINVGWLDRNQVNSYIRHSDVMWLPTLLECLPTTLLESMCLGTPIFSPDLDFARYVCDDAAVYYNPWDMKTIFNGLVLLRDNKQLRRILVENGKQQLRKEDKFPADWQVVARRTLDELHRLAGK